MNWGYQDEETPVDQCDRRSEETWTIVKVNGKQEMWSTRTGMSRVTGGSPEKKRSANDDGTLVH